MNLEKSQIEFSGQQKYPKKENIERVSEIQTGGLSEDQHRKLIFEQLKSEFYPDQADGMDNSGESRGIPIGFDKYIMDHPEIYDEFKIDPVETRKKLKAIFYN